MGINKINKAVFLDRDGVINKLIFRRKAFERSEYEPPFIPEELDVFDYVIESLRKLTDANYLLFLVSNQPDYAKGKTSLENLKKVHDNLHIFFLQNNVIFKEYYYCYHHPDGVVSEYTVRCECRKPGNKFVMDAVSDYGVEIDSSWLIGDRSSDILCGRKSGLKTIFIKHNLDGFIAGDCSADYTAENLSDAVDIIIKSK